MTIPAQIKISLTNYNQLMELMVWLDSMPDVIKNLAGDRFYENVWEKQLDLISYEDEDDKTEVSMVEHHHGHLYATFTEPETGDERSVPIVADGIEE